MKKTFTINLGGIVFHIDEDAYELLDKYLSNLRIHFNKEEGGEEIVQDMETLDHCLSCRCQNWCCRFKECRSHKT